MTKEKTLADKITFIDNLIDSTFSKKTYLYYRDIIKEIERLNNIINELEKYLNEQVDYMTHHSIERMVAFDCCRHRLQELKGSEKE